ncbi:hypothetical protein V2J09_000826 [Rumex salicifolius]
MLLAMLHIFYVCMLIVRKDSPPSCSPTGVDFAIVHRLHHLTITLCRRRPVRASSHGSCDHATTSHHGRSARHSPSTPLFAAATTGQRQVHRHPLDRDHTTIASTPEPRRRPRPAPPPSLLPRAASVSLYPRCSCGGASQKKKTKTKT